MFEDQSDDPTPGGSFVFVGAIGWGDDSAGMRSTWGGLRCGRTSRQTLGGGEV